MPRNQPRRTPISATARRRRTRRSPVIRTPATAPPGTRFYRERWIVRSGGPGGLVTIETGACRHRHETAEDAARCPDSVMRAYGPTRRRFAECLRVFGLRVCVCEFGPDRQPRWRLAEAAH